jgi:large subunit ribosomal protein L29
MVKKTKDIHAMTPDQLEEKLLANKKEMLNLRIQQSSGQLQNTAMIRKVRRETALINMLITELRKKG